MLYLKLLNQMAFFRYYLLLENCEFFLYFHYDFLYFLGFFEKKLKEYIFMVI